MDFSAYPDAKLLTCCEFMTNNISINQYQCMNKCHKLSVDSPFHDHSEFIKENYYTCSHTHFPAPPSHNMSSEKLLY